jgi:putative MFS transporter
VLLIVPLIPHLTVLGAFMLIGGFLVLAAVLAQFALSTRGRHFEEVAP